MIPPRAGMRLRSIELLAMVVAASAAVLIALRVTRALDLYCDWTSPCFGLLVAALPTYLAMLGMTLPVALIAVAANREQTSRELRLTTSVCAALALLMYLLMATASYDAMWANYGSTAQLDAPRFTPLLPSIVFSTSSVLWPVLLGASVVLVNLELGTHARLRLVAGLGVLAGFALVVAPSFGHEQVTALYVAFGLIMVWAGALAWRLLPTGNRTRSSAASHQWR